MNRLLSSQDYLRCGNFGVEVQIIAPDIDAQSIETTHPLYCIFPNCQNPETFKRKADWVHHELGVHRRPEYSACSFPECGLTFPCKNAFIRHLVQEHKLSAPMKKRKTLSKEQLVSPGDKEETLREIIEQRHREDPSAEKLCQFCGDNLSSWGS